MCSLAAVWGVALVMRRVSPWQHRGPWCCPDRNLLWWKQWPVHTNTLFKDKCVGQYSGDIEYTQTVACVLKAIIGSFITTGSINYKSKICHLLVPCENLQSFAVLQYILHIYVYQNNISSPLPCYSTIKYNDRISYPWSHLLFSMSRMEIQLKPKQNTVASIAQPNTAQTCTTELPITEASII